MDNVHLFELLNASSGLAPGKLLLAALLAKWVIAGVPVGIGWAWVRSAPSTRPEWLEMVLAVVISLVLAQFVTWVWPQPRPFALHLGTQYLEHASDPGMPSDHVTVFWSLSLSALGTRRLALLAMPLFAVGLAVGWSRVYLGVHFPYDIVAALPVSLTGALVAHLLRQRAAAGFEVLLRYDACVRTAVGRWFRRRVH
jgi:undecaprenyl-diphosphatase